MSIYRLALFAFVPYNRGLNGENMATLLKSVILRSDSDVEWARLMDTEVLVDDEGGGPFLVIKQPGIVDWLPANYDPQVRVGFDEVDELIQALQFFKSEWSGVK